MSPVVIVILPLALLLLYYGLSVWQIRNAAKRILGELRKNYTDEKPGVQIPPEPSKSIFSRLVT